MKILFISLTNSFGGMFQYAFQVVNSVSQLECKTYIILPQHANINNHFNQNISIYHVPFVNQYISIDMFRFDTLIKAVNKIEPDAIHITCVHPWLIPFMYILKNKYPIITTIHDVKKHPGDWGPLPFVIALNILKTTSTKLIVHGESLKSQLISEGIPEEKVAVIPPGTLLKYKKSEILEENLILFFGRIVDYKGIEYLIKAEPLISKQCPDIKIIIAGNGDFSKYESLIENIDKFEIINKYIPDDEIGTLFQKSKLIVLPYTEASQTGIVPISYQFKKPVVVTDVGGLPDIVENGVTGFVVPAKNSDALASAVIKLLKDETLRKKMGENALNKVNAELSWNNISQQMFQTYKEAINLSRTKVNL